MREIALNVWARVAFGVLGAGTIAICIVLAMWLLPPPTNGLVTTAEIVALLIIAFGGGTLVRAALRGRIAVRDNRRAP
jgi:uncharacterized membrane protein YidH (DUF202 family)